MSHDNDLDSFKKQVVEFIQKQLDQGIKLEDINLQGYVKRVNSTPRADFNGFSPEQMTRMLYFPFGPECPVQIRRLTDDQIECIPFMRQVLHLMRTLSVSDLKLTAKGYIPPRLVSELYELGCKEWPTYKSLNEAKLPKIQVLRFAMTKCGLIKTRRGIMSLTVKGLTMLCDANELFRTIIRFMFQEFDTSWHDLCNDREVGNVGRLYSLWLLHHFGNEQRHVDFYTAEYYKAFPQLDSKISYAYRWRVFADLFYAFGFCTLNNTEADRGLDFGQFITKTDLVETIFSFTEP